MDFKDVFGGPPKRYSMQERFSSESEEERSWSGLKEKRVFGDEEVRSRRRQQVEGDDFFSDIFKGAGAAAAAESSSYPSPTRRSSSFGSNPGSRIMSPLPPNLVDAFPSSLPPQFSLPVKVSKGVELPTFGSSPPLLSRFSSSHDDNDDDEMRHPQNNIFHFSIYKWAGTGSLPPIHLTPDFKKKSNDNNGMTNLFPMTTHHVDKPDTQIPVQPLNNSIHAFLNQPHHQEVKDKKPKTPTTGDDPKAETSPSLEKKKKNKKKSVKVFVQEERESAVPKDDKLQHKVDDNMNNHQPSQHSTNPNITLSSETLHTDSNISLENPDDPLDDNFLVEEIFDDQENVGEGESSCDDTRAIDAKIRQWSVGKKGNIRSLLSTLQYVLWEGSGWKAVALVDLIEVNSVKRAYQKALLRLHPDKLQQKGASFHHKYTAEKVFDILQEAWDHFNTCSVIV